MTPASLDRKPGQLIATKATPKPNQDNRHRATMTHQRLVISAFNRSCGFHFKPCDRPFKVLQQQRGGLLHLCRVHDSDAIDHRANVRRLGWIRETLGDVPLSKGCQALLQSVDGELVSILRQVANDAGPGRGQVPAPSHTRSVRSPLGSFFSCSPECRR